MLKDLTFLIQLQEVDQKIFALEQSKKEFPVELETHQGSIGAAAAAIAAIEKKQQDLVTQQKNVQHQIDEARISLQKSEGRLNSITTNREYDAVHSEIETCKHAMTNGANKLKHLEEDAQKLVTALQEAQAAQEQVKAEKQPRIDELQSRIDSIDSDIAQVRQGRDALVKNITPPNLRAYEHIIKRRKNARAIGLVSETDRVCLVCFKMLEPQLVNEIRKMTRVHICQSCGSMLVWHEAEHMSTDTAPEQESPKE